MRPYIAFLLIALASLGHAGFGIWQKPNLSPKDIYSKYADSVVEIECDLGGGTASVGTGFFFGSERKIATCFHVVKGAKSLKIHGTRGTTWKVKSVELDEESDCAVLLLSDDSTGRTPIPRGSYGDTATGDPITVIGNPLGFDELKNSLSTGVISGKRDSSAIPKIQISAAISPGSSGSPIITSAGSVVAYADFTVESGQSLNFGITIDSAAALIEKGKTVPISELAGYATVSKTEGSSTPPASSNRKARYRQLTDDVASWVSEVVDAHTRLEIAYWGVLDVRSGRGAVSWYKGFSRRVTELSDILSDRRRQEDLDRLSENDANNAATDLISLSNKCRNLTSDFSHAAYNIALDWTHLTGQGAKTKDEMSADSDASINAYFKLDDKVREFFKYGANQPWSDVNRYISQVSGTAVAASYAENQLGVLLDPDYDARLVVARVLHNGSPFQEGDAIKDVEYNSVTTTLPDWRRAVDFIVDHLGKTVRFTVSRGGVDVLLTVPIGK